MKPLSTQFEGLGSTRSGNEGQLDSAALTLHGGLCGRCEAAAEYFLRHFPQLSSFTHGAKFHFTHQLLRQIHGRFNMSSFPAFQRTVKISLPLAIIPLQMKLVNSIGKQFLGKTAGGFAKKGIDQITSSAFSFASTWAIGQLVQRYYANGRSWSGIDAKTTFQNLRHEAEQLHQKLLPQIQQQASTLD